MKRKYERHELLYCIPAEEQGSEIENENISTRSSLPPDTITCLIELGEALRNIHNRLIDERYSILEGEIIPPSSNPSHEPNTKSI